MKERGRFFSEPIQVWHVWLCQHVQQAWANWTAKNLEDTSHCDRVTFKNLLQWVAYKVNSLQRYFPIDQLCLQFQVGGALVRITVESFWPQFGLILHILPGFSASTAILHHVREVCFATQSERFGALPRATWCKLIPSIVHNMQVCVSETVMRL